MTGGAALMVEGRAVPPGGVTDDEYGAGPSKVRQP